MTHYKEADYYELLEVRPDAAPAEVEEAYKRQMELLTGESLATYGLFVADDLVHFRQRVEEAHRVLSDPARRRAYDAASGYAPEPVEAVAAAEPLVAREATAGDVAAAGDEAATAPVAMAGTPLEDEPFPETEEVEAAPAGATGLTSGAPRVPEAGALPPFGPSGPEAPVEPPPAPAEAPAAPEAAVAGGERFDGPGMRAVRERKRITLSSISQNTRIAEYYLEYIEGERFDSLPPPIYLRSYVRQYAAAIGVDEDRAVEGFLARYNDARNGK